MKTEGTPFIEMRRFLSLSRAEEWPNAIEEKVIGEKDVFTLLLAPLLLCGNDTRSSRRPGARRGALILA